jgi:tetraacyldisaccharide 4'-kinase
MHFKTPSFWYKENHLLSIILLPLAGLYKAIAAINAACQKKRAYKPQIPTICLGNIIAGGSGKTPAAIAIHKLVKAQWPHLSPVFLTRGYGGTEKNAVIVSSEKHSAAMVGDEALLLAKHGAVVKSADRIAGTQMAQDHKADLIIMDDGLQNHTLSGTIKIMIIQGTKGFGNGRLIPAGPLRENITTATERMDAFILVGQDKNDIVKTLPQNKPVFYADVITAPQWPANANTRYIGFCGLAHPDLFKKTIEDAGLTLKDFVSFADHHSYTKSNLDTLAQTAQAQNARLITTEKDAVKLPQSFIEAHKVEIVPIEMDFKDPQKLIDFIAPHLIKGAP